MIVLHEHRTLIWTPPKTGSCTLHMMFGAMYPGSVADWDEPSPILPRQHDLEIPEGCEDYRVLVSVRHPTARACSLFFHRLRVAPRSVGGQSVREFCEHLGRIGDPFYDDTIALFVGDQRVDGLIHLETLRGDLLEHGLIQHYDSIPRINDGLTPSYQEVLRYNPGIDKFIHEWAQDDYERWGYRR